MRVLIAIGCNEYDSDGLPSLGSAELDAQHIYATLMRPEIGEYDPDHSIILLSPSLQEMDDALSSVLFTSGPIDTFVFFFAGHGVVSNGSFYMLVRNSSLSSLTFSAFSLSKLFLAINESAPYQSNIIIDACNAGGLVSDLGVLLKPEILGDAGTPGVTLVATSAQDQESGETEAGGIGTRAILDCIEGREFVQDGTSSLDLVEIGRRVSTLLRTRTNQTPVVWGLNLYGSPRFCRNLRYGADHSRPLRDVLQAWPVSSDEFIHQNYEDLWRVYASVSEAWEPREFARTIEAVLRPLGTMPGALAGFVDRLSAAVLERARLSDDAYRSAQVGATLLVSLLPHIMHDEVARQAVSLRSAIAHALVDAGTELCEHIKRDRYALLQRNANGLSELFYLPQRISKVLGWTGAATLALESEVNDQEKVKILFETLIDQLIENYEGSFVVMSNAQAGAIAIAVCAAQKCGLREQAERIIGLLFFSMVDCGGQIARSGLPSSKALDYLKARALGELASTIDLVERPNETTTVLLKSAVMLGLGDVFDEDLYRLDGHSFLAYINSDFSQFGSEMMSGGDNLVWTIGQDIFRVRDFEMSWPKEIEGPDEQIAGIMMLASLLYPDRVPWFVFDNQSD